MNNKMASRVQVEMNNMSKNPIEGVTAVQDQTNIQLITFYMAGPKGSVYEDGVFNILCTLGDSYPFKAPMFQFKTAIYHPGVDQKDGKVCQQVYEANWAPTQTLANVLGMIRGMLLSPSLDNMVDEEIGNVFKSSQSTFEKTAREWVKKYAKQ